jgi:ATP-dependent Clp protease ATP-binding subunit ClpA
LLVHAQRRARESGSNTVNVLHFLQVLLQPENKAEVDLLKECGLDVEKGLTELVQRYRADDTDSAEDK